jgi:D-alanyl-D-alanine carboxypeptidase (penicillin-binding protein 5/6)
MYKYGKIRFAAALFALLFIISASRGYALVQFESSAGSALLMEASTGRILYEKNADVPVPPASITKLMTLLIGLDAVDEGKAKWDDLVPVSEAAWTVEGSEMFLEAGKSATYKDVITGISVVSANDGCIALAEYLYGSEGAFVEEMNRRAGELGLSNTQFKDATGLPAPGHTMSARDIAVLARSLMEKHPEILEIESTREFTFNNIHQYNRNPLLGVYPGADGLKTGWTTEAGYCLVGTAKKDGIRMISVALNTKDEKERLKASQDLLDYGFENFQLVNFKNAGDIVGEIEVTKGKEFVVPVKIDSSISAVVPNDRKNDIKTVLVKTSDSLEAPVAAGTSVGRVDVQLDGKTLATAAASTAEDAPKAGFFTLFFRSIGSFFRSLFN